MGIEQIRMNQTKALPPAFQFNWSQILPCHTSRPSGALPILTSASTMMFLVFDSLVFSFHAFIDVRIYLGESVVLATAPVNIHVTKDMS